MVLQPLCTEANSSPENLGKVFSPDLQGFLQRTLVVLIVRMKYITVRMKTNHQGWKIMPLFNSYYAGKLN